MKTKNMLFLFAITGIVSADGLESTAPSQFSAQVIQDTLNPVTTQNNTEIFNTEFKEYIVNQYDQPTYADHISKNPDDFVNLLTAVKESNLKQDGLFQAYTILKLFHDKFKSIDFIDDNVVNTMLAELPRLTKSYFKFEHKASLSDIKGAIEYQLQVKLLEHFDVFASDPETCLSMIAQNLAERQQAIIDQMDDINKLKNMTTRFVEGCLNKIFWNSNSYDEIIDSLLTTPELLKNLYSNNMIGDEDELDSLYWSLTHRVCLYMELRGSMLPAEFYEKLESYLQEGKINFLEEEQDALITPKKEVFATSLLRAEISSRAAN